MVTTSFNLLYHSPFSIEEDLKLEEKAITDLLVTARQLATRYQNQYRWPLELEEIFGELQLEIAKAINKYLYCKNYSEFIKLGRKMLWNRTRELLSRAYGTTKSNEWTAYSLPEELDEYGETYEMFTSFSISDNYAKLSDLAKKIIELITDPDDKLHEALTQHISYRGKLYKSGAGMNGIPAKILADVLDISVNKVKQIFEEISEAIKQEMNFMVAIKDNAIELDFAASLVTWENYIVNDMPVKYIRWTMPQLEAQAKYRGLAVEDFSKRSQLVRALQQDDINSGRKSDTETPLFVPIAGIAKVEGALTAYVEEEEEFEKLPVSGNKEETVVKMPSYVKTEEDKYKKIGQIEDDDFFSKPKKLPVKASVEDIASELDTNNEEVIEAIENQSENLEDEEFEKAELEAVNFVPQASFVPATPTLEGFSIQSELQLFAKLLAELEVGKKILITRLAPDQWQVETVSSYATGEPNIGISVSFDEAKPKKEKGKKTEEYKKATAMLREFNINDLVNFALSEGLEWKHADDDRITRMRITSAYLKKHGIEKYMTESYATETKKSHNTKRTKLEAWEAQKQ